MLFLVQAFPLHLCNLSLVVGDDSFQSGVQVVLLICQEFVLLKHRKEKRLETREGTAGFKNSPVTHAQKYNDPKWLSTNNSPLLSWFLGRNSSSALRILCADSWAAYQQNVLPKCIKSTFQLYSMSMTQNLNTTLKAFFYPFSCLSLHPVIKMPTKQMKAKKNVSIQIMLKLPPFSCVLSDLGTCEGRVPAQLWCVWSLLWV